MARPARVVFSNTMQPMVIFAVLQASQLKLTMSLQRASCSQEAAPKRRSQQVNLSHWQEWMNHTSAFLQKGGVDSMFAPVAWMEVLDAENILTKANGMVIL